jgi:hypothetical protein
MARKTATQVPITPARFTGSDILDMLEVDEFSRLQLFYRL